MPPKKSKGVKMEWTEFMNSTGEEDFRSRENFGGSSWADDVDLPTAPAASQGYADGGQGDSYGGSQGRERSYNDRERERHPREPEAPQITNFPSSPPYTIYIGNLSYDITERDLEDFFANLQIKSIRLLRDGDKIKGYGYVEFADLESLKVAVGQARQPVCGRPIKIDLATAREDTRRSDSFGGDRVRADIPESNWRRADAVVPAPRAPSPSFSDRSGGYDRGGYGDRSRGFGGDRSGDRGFSGSDRGSFRGSFSDRDRGYDRGPRSRDSWSNNLPPAGSAAPPKERRKLELKPRSVTDGESVVSPLAEVASPVSEVSATLPSPAPSEEPKKPKPNPFGDAKPRDEAEIQRRIEERRREREAKRLAEEEEAARKAKEEKEAREEEARIAKEKADEEARVAAEEAQKRKEQEEAEKAKNGPVKSGDQRLEREGSGRGGYRGGRGGRGGSHGPERSSSTRSTDSAPGGNWRRPSTSDARPQQSNQSQQSNTQERSGHRQGYGSNSRGNNRYSNPTPKPQPVIEKAPEISQKNAFSLLEETISLAKNGSEADHLGGKEETFPTPPQNFRIVMTAATTPMSPGGIQADGEEALVFANVPRQPVSTNMGASGSKNVGVLWSSDGDAVSGHSFGYEGASVSGELVFQTGMVGYTESLTDPSYRGQILVITFPLVGNYGVPSREEVEANLNNLQKYFESNQIHISGLIVGQYSHDYSHYLATSSLSEWLIEHKVPALYGIDTRALTKKIRSYEGALLAKILFTKAVAKDAVKAPEGITPGTFIPENPAWLADYADVAWHDPNIRNLVAEVSVKKPIIYQPEASKALKDAKGKPIRVVAVDIGMKNNQIRCLVNRGVEVKVVPWNADILAEVKDSVHGVFLSNGPGDPTTIKETIASVKILLESKKVPVFGICLGHQVMALAAGAKTLKMPYGNRGHNIPCTNMDTGRCYITSQNHGYAVDVGTLPAGWRELFVNANDGSNEGIAHDTLPYFSVQFHPESTPGPLDTEFLFDKFISAVLASAKAGTVVSIPKDPRPDAPPRLRPRKVLVLGSGGLSIGQAGEFDYSGSQAIKALKEEGIYTILINPNIATIQTSKGLADKVYFLPVTPDFVRKVIKHEKPDGIYCTFGGQTALNVGVKLKDEFAGLGVQVLGTPIETIEITEDRELFAQHMAQINEKCAQSSSATTIDEAVAAAKAIGYPLIVRAAYALGGLGSGFVSNEAELRELCTRAFATSPQVLVEKSMKGWKEIEYEVVRDAYDNCITVCNMENFDPLGIHTGDSIVVAPSQTLSDEDYMMLRRTAVNVIRHLGVIGECNIQYALNPKSKEYCIIEVNARLSRSSALASKATGYPLAFVAAKLGLNIPLTEVKNNVTKKTIACFEPSLDYCVVKIPRWDLKKFHRVSTKISSSMKSVGEVMAIGRTFQETIQKAICSVDFSFIGFSQNDVVIEEKELDEELRNPSDQRLFAIAAALHRNYSVDKIHELTSIDRWFLNKLKNIVDTEKALKEFTLQSIPGPLLKSSKEIGMSDRQIAKAIGTTELAVRKLRINRGITPFVKQIDTVAAEFPAFTNYLYMTYNAIEHDINFNDNGIMVIGSGVYRIGSSVEFDWCAVRSIRTLREEKIKTIMINYNPETVSTDYDEADRLYFETITLERVLDIYQLERADGVIVSMGGQTPNNISLPLHRENVKILGTSPEMIDNAENRYKFSRMLDKIDVDQPQWKELTSIDDARVFCDKVGYPVLVRPSYVLSGAAMNVVNSPSDLKNFLELAVTVSPEFPVVITKFIEEAKEIEMDAVAHNGKLVMHVVTEHVENAGVHSGDATLVLPPQDLDPETVRKIENATRKIANALNVTGPLNIQFIAKNNEIKVIECNVRASRSFPFVSKVIGVDLIEMATKAMVGRPYEAYPKVEIPQNYVCVKVPQFSFSRLSGADPVLGVEMASTGEVACFGASKYEAYLKGLIATGFVLPKKNILLSIGSFKEKMELFPSVEKLHQLGYNLFATAGTADFLQEHNVPVKFLEIDEVEDEEGNNKGGEHSLSQHLGNNLIDLYVNLPSKNRFRRPASYMSRGYRTRRMAVDFAIPLITNVKCAKLFFEALARMSDFDVSGNDYKTSHRHVILPGLINIQNLFPGILNAPSSADGTTFSTVSKAALAGGFTLVCNLPYGVGAKGELVKDRRTLTVAQGNIRGVGGADGPACDYTLSIAASGDNAVGVAAVGNDVASLLLDLGSAASSNSISQLTSHIRSWPSEVPIVASARGSDLASVLFLANLHNRAIHVTGIATKEDVALIRMAKEKGVVVTCDVFVHHLFLSRKDVPGSEGLLFDQADVQSLWENLDIIDCFSVGPLPYNLAAQVKGADTIAPSIGLEEALPLLFTAVADGRITLDDIVLRLHENPARIFDLPEQTDTYVEVEVDRLLVVPPGGFSNFGTSSVKSWSPFAGKSLYGSVSRVVLRGQTVYLDGTFFGPPSGRDITNMVRLITKNISVHTPRRPAAAGATTILTSTTAAKDQSEDRLGLKSPRTRVFPLPLDSASGLPPLGPSATSLEAIGVPGSVVAASTAVSTSGARDLSNLMLGPSLSNVRELAEELEGESAGVGAVVKAYSRGALEKSLNMSGAKYISDLPSSVAAVAPSSPFYRKHILSVHQFSRNELHILFGVAQEMRTLVERQGSVPLLIGKVLCCAFYEPSTRTSSSFEAAMLRLGGTVVKINEITSSVAKGESLGDTVRTLSCYGDAIVLRHPMPGSAETAANFSPVPIINAGDGIGEHPTQAFLDAFTIREELGTVNGLTITMVGDLKHGRTVHSLVRLLSLYDVKINYVSPKSLRMPDEIKEEVRRSGTPQHETESLDSVIASTDVLYVTRIQKERFSDLGEYERVHGSYIITNKVLQKAKTHMIVMHPLPRVNEIDPEVDFDQRAAYFRQMKYGMYVRMALLAQVMGRS
ncbi:hypothetical protein HDU97_010078 [Phlyctochytrium planicorne]|nr:hypothetical protein HDU97_010078 [Phlyctochytrium planicorne]